MIRVLIVDDSAVVRKVLSDELSKYPDVEVVGTAVDPFVARDKIAQLKPDVLTLDIEMPRMGGLSFLAKLMRHHPIPTVIVSSVAPKNSEAALQALALGAVEVISKPGTAYSVPQVGRELVRAIRAASVARLRKPDTSAPAPTVSANLLSTIRTTHKLLAIGASTGGTQAIESVLSQLPRDLPGTVVVQHMPAGFTKSFAQRLNDRCAMEIREAADGDVVAPGLVLIAPGGYHMLLERSGAQYEVRIKTGPPVHHQRPAVDVLFQTVARHAGRNAVGVILTGMGADGAQGLLSMRQAGAQTLAQDEKSCVVFGMPKQAIDMGAAEQVVALDGMPKAILQALQPAPAARTAAVG